MTTDDTPAEARVKPLEWWPDEAGGRTVVAQMLGHRYYVGPCGGEPEQWQWLVDFAGARAFPTGKAASEDEAKAAAQADFAARVLSCLAPAAPTAREAGEGRANG